MDAPRYLNLPEAKAQLLRLADAAHQGASVVLTKHGRPWARLVPLEADGLGFLPLWPSHLQRAGTISRVRLSQARLGAALATHGEVDSVDAVLVAQAELENLRVISLDGPVACLGARPFW